MEGFVVTPEHTYAFFLILLRTSSMLVSAPLLSHKGIPSYTKVGFALFFSLVLVPLQGDNPPPAPQTFAVIIDDSVREVLFGLALGLAMNVVFIGVQMASRLIGLQIGFGLGAVFDPITGAEFGAFDQFYALLVTLVFFAMNGHYLVIQTLAETTGRPSDRDFQPVLMTPDGLGPWWPG